MSVAGVGGAGVGITHLHTKQFYHFSSDLDQLDEVRAWEKRRKKKWEFYTFHN